MTGCSVNCVAEVWIYYGRSMYEHRHRADVSWESSGSAVKETEIEAQRVGLSNTGLQRTPRAEGTIYKAQKVMRRVLGWERGLQPWG